MGDGAYDCDQAMFARDERQSALDALVRIKLADKARALAQQGLQRVGVDGGKVVMTKARMLAQYELNVKAKVGDMMKCACCGKDVKKGSYQQKFCVKANAKGAKRHKCKDIYWNVVDEARAARANAHMGL